MIILKKTALQTCSYFKLHLCAIIVQRFFTYTNSGTSNGTTPWTIAGA